MSGLSKIRDLAQQYDVSTRTLRYYEEIGILWSQRTADSAYRSYDAAAVTRLQQILLLRKLGLPVKDLQAIFTTKDPSVVLAAVARKLQTIETEMAALAELKASVESFLLLLREQDFNRLSGLQLLPERTAALLPQSSPPLVNPILCREDLTMPTALSHVRIIELKPMKVAACRAESPSPESDAWVILAAWMEERRLQHLSTTRVFGYNNPGPTQGNPVYGYEMWAAVPEGTEASGPVTIKNFSGGLYAVTTAYLYEIPQRWRQLSDWLNENKQWAYGPHQCLEETISPWGTPDSDLQLDLLMPIVKK